METNFREPAHVIIFTDILHHVPDPEAMVLQAIENLDRWGYIVIMDNNVESWEDVFYLDCVHKAFATATGLAPDSDGVLSYLPTFGYRSRSYWEKFLAERKFKIKGGSDIDWMYKGYVEYFSR
jgi:hypothetical protein